jgi:adenosylcobinamide-phosphate synthase
MVVFVTGTVYVISLMLVSLSLRYLGYWAGSVVPVYLAYTTISVKSLKEAALDVLSPLREEDLHGARKMLSMVVGRDTEGLPQPEVVRGTVETVAENTSDGVVAPLFYLAIGGAPLALAYKAINTMDSMAGYKSERYINFGMAAAKLDDVANYIPARLTGLMMAGATAVLSMLHPESYSDTGAWRIYRRDNRNHPSPNSGHPEAAMAGALGVQLGGESSYAGVKSVKPYIGDPDHKLGPEKIADAVRLMLATSILAVAVSALLSSLVNILVI